jgi:hypothetical protein
MISMFHPTEYRVCGLPRNRGRPAYAYAYDRRLHFLEYASHFCEPARILRSGLRLTSIDRTAEYDWEPLAAWPKASWHVESKPLERVDAFKYLGRHAAWILKKTMTTTIGGCLREGSSSVACHYLYLYQQ